MTALSGPSCSNYCCCWLSCPKLAYSPQLPACVTLAWPDAVHLQSIRDGKALILEGTYLDPGLYLHELGHRGMQPTACCTPAPAHSNGHSSPQPAPPVHPAERTAQAGQQQPGMQGSPHQHQQLSRQGAAGLALLPASSMRTHS